MTTLSPAARELLAKPLFGVIATVTAKGAPAQALVWYLPTDDEILVTTSADAFKIKHIERNGWASLTVSEGRLYVAVRGRPRVERDPATVTAEFERIVRRYLPPAAADQWIANAANGSARVIIHLPIEHVNGV